MAKTIGIDLGTTNSCVSVIEGGAPTIIPNKEGGRTTPSVVAIAKGELIVGETAKRQAVVNSANTISSIKRKMGTQEKVRMGDKDYLPQEVSAMILRSLKASAEEFIGEKVTDAIITVPAYFNDAQRQATKEAGQIAGLNVKRIINEPTAAAIAYGVSNNVSQKVMVYDLGGGTFDISIIEFGNDVIEVLATSGNNRLGGDDFDNVLTQYLIQEFQRESGVDISNEPTAVQRVVDAAEKAKKELSSALSTNVNIPFLWNTSSGACHLDTTITRAKFESLIGGMINSTKVQMDSALSDARLSIADIDKILLVGGSTRIPLVSAKITEWTGKEPCKNINPDESVAMGAAIQGENLSNPSSTALLLLDVTPLSLGVELADGSMRVMIKRNTTIPASHSEIFTNYEDWQDSMQINVCQGERPMAADNKLIGSMALTDMRPAPKGKSQANVTFQINEDGIMQVSAVDMQTQKKISVTINSKNMSQSEIARAIADAERFEAADNAKKERIEACNGAEQAINKSNAFLKGITSSDDIGAIKAQQDILNNLLKDNGASAEAIKRETEIMYDIMKKAYGDTEDAAGVDSSGFRSNSEKTQDFYDNL